MSDAMEDGGLGGSFEGAAGGLRDVPWGRKREGRPSGKGFIPPRGHFAPQEGECAYFRIGRGVEYALSPKNAVVVLFHFVLVLF